MTGIGNGARNSIQEDYPEQGTCAYIPWEHTTQVSISFLKITAASHEGYIKGCRDVEVRFPGVILFVRI